ncbi:conjugal transfer protein Trbc [Burkholderiales bacterium GJ-E10]|nr:conjugal transfer protein Trbc [Burkholderiales bacterium GJ-E10]
MGLNNARTASIFRRPRLAAARRMLFAAAVAATAMNEAHATGAGGLPWDGAISTLQNDLTGPVATGISVIAFLAAGAALVFGEELGGIAKKALYVVLGVAFIVLGNSFLAALGLTGTLVI